VQKQILMLLLGGALRSSRVTRAAESKTGQTLAVAAVQMRSSRDLADNLIRIIRSFRDCAHRGARVVVFPECALTGYFGGGFMKHFTQEQLADVERQVAEACREHNVYAIIGMPYRDGTKLFNSAAVISPAGQLIERYHKIHSEPWSDPGDHLSVFKVDGISCSIIICHDERYPELVRLPVLAGARLIFYISNESGIREEKKISPYRAQIQARAMEHTVYVVPANAPANPDATGSHGQSRIIAPDGNIVEEATMFDEDVVTATFELSRASGALARASANSGPLRDWWEEGVRRVRLVE
jgi:predicted amidohydrolase